MNFFKTSVAIALLASVCSFAGIDLTIGGGLNISNIRFSGYDTLPSTWKTPMHLGFNAGVNARFAFNPKTGLVAGLNYETRGVKEDLGTGYTSTIATDYLQIPILFSYKVLPELAVNIGPEFGIYLRGTRTSEGPGLNQSGKLQNFSAQDLGASIQATYTIADMIVVGAGYYYGLLNIDSDPAHNGLSGAINNSNIKITVAYLLHL